MLIFYIKVIVFYCKCNSLLAYFSHLAYDIYREVDTEAHSAVLKCIRNVNAAIIAHNRCVQNKLDNPFESMKYDCDIGLLESFRNLNKALHKLESARLAYNDVINHRKTARETLQRLLDDLAHYQIAEAFASLCRQRVAQEMGIEEYEKLANQIDELDRERIQLDSKRKNFQIA